MKEAGSGPAGAGNLQAYAEHCLGSPEVETKLAVSHEAWRACLAGELDFGIEGEPRPIGFARFPERPRRVDPRGLPRRGINTVDGRVALLHAVAHIEFSAIQLAWDHLYRFRGLPQDYYLDWLRVAAEEAEHFTLVRQRLRELGADYGDLPVHGGLWSMAEETAYDVAARMALVPRFMEARGLDVTPGMIERLRRAGMRAASKCSNASCMTRSGTWPWGRAGSGGSAISAGSIRKSSISLWWTVTCTAGRVGHSISNCAGAPASVTGSSNCWSLPTFPADAPAFRPLPGCRNGSRYSARPVPGIPRRCGRPSASPSSRRPQTPGRPAVRPYPAG